MSHTEKNRSILFVDPDPGLCKAAGDTLADAGYKVVTSHDVDDALVRLAAEKFDLVITELDNSGFYGAGVYLSAMKRHKYLSKSSFLFTCGDETRLYALSCSSLRYIEKPFTASALLSLVDTILRPGAKKSPSRSTSDRRALERFEWREDCNIYEPGARVPKAAAVTLDVSEDGVRIRLSGRALKPQTDIDVQTSSVYIKAKARVVWSADAGENVSIAGLKLSSRLPNALILTSLTKNRRRP